MINIKNLIVGQAVTEAKLGTWISAQSYTIYGRQLIGDAVQWHNGAFVDAPHQLDFAPDGTNVYVREHYQGCATLTKHNGAWYCTALRLSS